MTRTPEEIAEQVYNSLNLRVHDGVAHQDNIEAIATALRQERDRYEGCEHNGPHSRQALMRSLDLARDHEAALIARANLLAAEVRAWRAARDEFALRMNTDRRGLVSDPRHFPLHDALKDARAATDAAKALEGA